MQAVVCTRMQDKVATQAEVCDQLSEAASSLIAAVKPKGTSPMKKDTAADQLVTTAAPSVDTPTMSTTTTGTSDNAMKPPAGRMSYSDIVTVDVLTSPADSRYLPQPEPQWQTVPQKRQVKSTCTATPVRAAGGLEPPKQSSAAEHEEGNRDWQGQRSTNQSSQVCRKCLCVSTGPKCQ